MASSTFMVIYMVQNHKLELFRSFKLYFSPLKYVRGTYFTLFQPKFEFSYGQVYGCQVLLVTIYGLDMVAKIYLLWSTRDVMS